MTLVREGIRGNSLNISVDIVMCFGSRIDRRLTEKEKSLVPVPQKRSSSLGAAPSRHASCSGGHRPKLWPAVGNTRRFGHHDSGSGSDPTKPRLPKLLYSEPVREQIGTTIISGRGAGRGWRTLIGPQPSSMIRFNSRNMLVAEGEFNPSSTFNLVSTISGAKRVQREGAEEEKLEYTATDPPAGLRTERRGMPSTSFFDSSSGLTLPRGQFYRKSSSQDSKVSLLFPL
ncbi:hypothetical protein DFH09DRAFT_1086183 [Mycena vulgaris]|nr:hypothetical protein DFH09DRAFT_1086183 [Mycena vulgaris]